MNGFIVIARSEEVGDLGYLAFSTDELAAFLAINHGMDVFSRSQDVNLSWDQTSR